MTQQPHQKIILDLSRTHLRPIGLVQLGRSRTWLDDHGWWTTVVEFQPSSFRKGTYLNAGVNFHWYPQHFLSYDLSYRAPGFVEYDNDNQFEKGVRKYVDIALEKIEYYRKGLSDLKSASSFILKRTKGSWGFSWTTYHRANAYAISMKARKARSELMKIIKGEAQYKWSKELQERAKLLHCFLPENLDKYINKLREYIVIARQLKKLPKMALNFFLQQAR
ncbi:MAG: hypothetical protein ACFFAS_14550 [Promethearchaeota archaeon]